MIADAPRRHVLASFHVFLTFLFSFLFLANDDAAYFFQFFFPLSFLELSSRAADDGMQLLSGECRDTTCKVKTTQQALHKIDVQCVDEGVEMKKIGAEPNVNGENEI